MRFSAYLLLLCMCTAFCSDVHFLAPQSEALPDPLTVHISGRDLVYVTDYLLGLKAKAPSTWRSDENIMRRPRALAILEVKGGKLLRNLPTGYALRGDENEADFSELITENDFGKNQEWLKMGDSGISGTQMADDAENSNSVVEIKTRSEPLRREIENLYKISNSILESKIINSLVTPTIFIININGLGELEAAENFDDLNMGIDELEKAIDYFVKALKKAFDGRVIVELLTKSNTESERRFKRQASEGSRINNLRSKLLVYKFVSTDFPAIFAIFAGIIIILTLAILFIVVALLNMDPGKDSIIYRMTTTRMKKD